ncbi:MAG: rod shape-determining protein MreC [Ruminococcus sp.]|nr:rod shape-determining protein MreC [Ruminococcus sp.]
MKRRRAVLLVTLLLAALAEVCAPAAQGVRRLTGGALRLTAEAAATLRQPSYEDLQAENERLSAALGELRTTEAENAALRAENERLLRYFHLQKSQPSLTLLPAVVVARHSRDDNGFTLNVGADLGVQPDNAVVADSGLVGYVLTTDSDSCRVSTLYAPRTRVSVRDAATADSGILSGTDGELRMEHLAEDSRAQAGDLIVTSGDGGVYPENLIIGTVEAVRLDAYDASRYAVVRPAVDMEALADAAVVTAFEEAEVKRHE